MGNNAICQTELDGVHIFNVDTVHSFNVRHYHSFSEVISLQIHVFSSCTNGKQVLHENQCGIENEGGCVQSDAKVREVVRHNSF